MVWASTIKQCCGTGSRRVGIFFDGAGSGPVSISTNCKAELYFSAKITLNAQIITFMTLNEKDITPKTGSGSSLSL
jgi:hypothetical protein